MADMSATAGISMAAVQKLLAQLIEKKYNCHKLVYFEEYSEVEMAIAREKQLKKWSRPKKDTLIATMNKEWEDLMPW
jgi:predicted GIY-YIG superfamily endonuclease